MKLIKSITAIALLTSLASITCGFILDVSYSQKLIGFGVVGLFLVVFPLFSYYRWKDKDFKDYMLTQENLDKMRKTQKEKKL
ncbi:hypothetical protein J4050_01875 [Winogradskyella sp. DF17]|uniref:Lipoprotein n=1 Tax=Winogradskyella pelagia TaxID=2819984 RepID=A0ABS3SY98_9FLAO|nr:hypothetical protein [Winogradskyella sp. DF17]MBO3115475.1 hypothetical protein [Winogradskyella sp. DF17]